MRIAIIGNSGSGKSTLAHQLAAVHTLTPLELDSIVWEPGKVGVLRSRDARTDDARAFCQATERWVVEGCYAELTQTFLEHSPVLLFMEPGMEACLSNCRSRPWEPRKYTSKEQQDEMLEFLLSWVRDYYTRGDDLSLRVHQSLFEGYGGPKYLLEQPVDRAFVEAQPLRWFSHQVDDFAARFQSCAIPESAWTHSAHLVVGLWHVHRYGAEGALHGSVRASAASMRVTAASTATRAGITRRSRSVTFDCWSSSSMPVRRRHCRIAWRCCWTVRSRQSGCCPPSIQPIA